MSMYEFERDFPKDADGWYCLRKRGDAQYSVKTSDKNIAKLLITGGYAAAVLTAVNPRDGLPVSGDEVEDFAEYMKTRVVRDVAEMPRVLKEFIIALYPQSKVSALAVLQTVIRRPTKECVEVLEKLVSREIDPPSIYDGIGA